MRPVLCQEAKALLPWGQQNLDISQRSCLKSNIAGVQVEQPFEVLAMDVYCRGCEASVVEVMETHQGQTPVCGAASTDL